MKKSKQPPIEELYQECYRQILHIAVALFIIPLRWFWFWYAIEIALAAFLWNLFIMPMWFKDSFRPVEKQKGYSTGMLVYPLSIMIMALVFPLPILAAGWAVLSLSDGFATLFGKLFGKTALPWNKNKTWIGSFSFWISAAIFGWIALLWTVPNIECSSPFSYRFINWLTANLFHFEFLALDAGQEIADSISFLSQYSGQLLICSSLAGLGAAIIESLSIPKLDDNLLAPICYSLFLLTIFIFLNAISL